jgi:hypothetical protein
LLPCFIIAALLHNQQALWDFGGKMRQMQQHWRRLQEEIRRAPPKRPRRTPAPTYSGPLLLLNQQYWEKGLGANISSITGENMFGINMFGSYASLCQHMLNSSSGSRSGSGSPAAAGNNAALPCSSSSNAPLSDSAGGNSSNNVVLPALAHVQDQQQQQEDDACQPDADAGAIRKGSAASSSIGGDDATHSSNSSCSHAEDSTAALPTVPAAAAEEVYDFAEIELVCRQQKLTHLPASRRFVRALRIIRAAKQQQQQQQGELEQQQQQQQQQGLPAVQSPVQSISLVAVV